VVVGARIPEGFCIFSLPVLVFFVESAKLLFWSSFGKKKFGQDPTEPPTTTDDEGAFGVQRGVQLAF
jgi:hypothetical protein